MTIAVNLIFTLIMLFLAFVDIRSYLKKEHKDLKSAILSLGILGTFLGIFIGLMGFDTTNIQQSVPNMLGGLKIAFFTSIAGMSIAVSLFVFQKFKPVASPQDSNAEYINRQLEKLDMLEKLDKLDYLEMLKALYHQKEIDNTTKETNEEIKKLSIYLKSSHQQTYDLLLSSFEHTLNALKNATQEISKGASKEIIDALGTVIKDFNNNLNEQFGDNFKELNAGVQNLIEWQNRYKSSIEESEKALKSASASLSSSKDTFEFIASKNSDILEVYRELSLIINTYSNQAKTLNTQLEQYARLGDKSQEMLESIDKLFVSSSEKYGLLGENFENYIISSKEKIESILRDFIDKSYEQNRYLIDQIKSESENSQEQLRNLMQSTSIFFKEEIELFNQSSQEISQNLQDSSKSALQKHSSSLDEISSESVELYRNHARKLAELLEDSQHSSKSFRDDLSSTTEAFTLTLQKVHEDSKELMNLYHEELLENQKEFALNLQEEAKNSFRAIEGLNSDSLKEFSSSSDALTRESIDSIKTTLEGSASEFEKTQKVMIDSFRDTKDEIANSSSEIKDSVVTNLQEVKDALQDSIKTQEDYLHRSTKALTETIHSSSQALNTNIQSSNQTLNNAITSSSKTLHSDIVSSYELLQNETKGSIDFLKEQLFQSIQSSVTHAISSSEKFLKTFIDDLSTNSKESQEIIFTILESVKSSVDTSREAINSLSSSAKSSIEESFKSASNSHKLLSEQGGKTLSQLDLLTKKLMIEQKNMLKNSLNDYNEFVQDSKSSLETLFTTIDEFNTEFTLKNSETLGELSESTKKTIEEISSSFKEHSTKTVDDIKSMLERSSAEYMATLEKNTNEGKDIPIKIAQNIKVTFLQAQKEISAYSKSTNSSILSSKEMAEKLNIDVQKSIKEQVEENKKLNEEMQKGLRILDNSLQNVVMNFKNDYEWFLRRIRELMGADRI